MVDFRWVMVYYLHITLFLLGGLHVSYLGKNMEGKSHA